MPFEKQYNRKEIFGKIYRVPGILGYDFDRGGAKRGVPKIMRQILKISLLFLGIFKNMHKK